MVIRIEQKHFLFDLGDYTKVRNSHCAPQKYGSYDTLTKAKVACSSDEKCSAVYDTSCDSDGHFSLCPVGFAENYAAQSCLYRKQAYYGRYFSLCTVN